MKKKHYFEILLAFCLFFFTSVYARDQASLVNIDKIHVQSTETRVKIIFETDSSLPVVKTYYLQDSPQTIAVEWTNVNAVSQPDFDFSETDLILSMRVLETGANQHRFLIHLREQVPYRIDTDENQTVIELYKIQRTQGVYAIDRETKKSLVENDKPTVLLKNIDVSEKENRVDITAKMSGKAVSNIFALENPFRLVVDLFETLNNIGSSSLLVNKLGVKRVRTSQFQSSNPMISRIVFDLGYPKFYELNSQANKLVFSFFKEDILQAPPPISEPPLEAAEADTTPIQPEEKITKEIPETKKTLDQEPVNLKPVIKETKAPVSKKPVYEKKEPEKAAVPPTLSSPPSLKEETDSSFFTPVQDKKAVNTKKPDNSEISLSTKEIKPPIPVKKEPKTAQPEPQENLFKPKVISEGETGYSGEILSLKFKDADLRDVILYLGSFAGLNVVFDPEVSGRVTCDLVDVPWDQALDIILKINKMGKTLEGNILRIAPLSVLTREQDQQRRLRESMEMAGPIEVKTVTLSYSKAGEIQKLLSTKLSARGQIIIDARTNTLIISDIKERLDMIDKLISVLDTPTPQVSIEARIVEATANFTRNLGIQWGFRGVADPFYGNQTSLQFPNKLLADGSIIRQGIITRGIGGPLGGYAINLPAPAFSSAIGLSFGNVVDTFRLDVALSALERTGEGRIISSPRVTTQNNMEAEIIQGRQIPVQTQANFTVSTRYVNAALELRATPQITAEGTIIMTLEIQNNAADFANLVQGIPPIITQRAKTTVMIRDGGTTVIGGIYRTEDSVTKERVPFLYKIPILGALFRNSARTRQNRELLIFITPRIIKE